MFLEIFFSFKCIKIIYIFNFLKIIFDITHQNNLKTQTNINLKLKNNKNFKKF
jgi:hypothetical protein